MDKLINSRSVQRVFRDLMSSSNPMLGMAILSLLNALELYQGKKERHNLGAIIFIDLSVECILKAKLFQIDPGEFIDNQTHLGFSDVTKLDDKIQFLEDEKSFISKVHTARNKAQHRGSIPDSLSTLQFMQWDCKFLRRFAKDNFGLNLNSKVPSEQRITWLKLIREYRKKLSTVSFKLKRPLDVNYRCVEKWISDRVIESNKGFLGKDYKNSLLYSLRRYCKYLQMDPKTLIENAKKGLLSPDQDLKEFLTNIKTSPPYYNAITSFYRTNGIFVDLPRPEYHRKYKPKSITTEQLRKICNIADVENQSWILANSYMGLKTGEIGLLKVEDFHIKNWKTLKNIYPVKIRKEISGNYDYTTFIGVDAMQALKKYFDENTFRSQEIPWDYSQVKLNKKFKNYAIKARIINSQTDPYSITPKSLIIRLRKTLRDSGMRYDWIQYVLGAEYSGNRPLDQEIEMAYLEAFPHLKVSDISS